MQRISESAESLFGDLHKPFSTASVITDKTQDEHNESAFRRTATSALWRVMLSLTAEP
jgi:hypothetical protein